METETVFLTINKGVMANVNATAESLDSGADSVIGAYIWFASELITENKNLMFDLIGKIKVLDLNKSKNKES